MAENRLAEPTGVPRPPGTPSARRTLPFLGWLCFALCVSMVVTDVTLLFLNREAGHPSGLGNDAVELVAAVAYGAVALVGAVIVSRRASNCVGWIFCGGALLAATGAACSEYAGYALITDRGSLPGPDIVAWVGVMAWWVGAGTVVTFGLLLYPDGRLLSPPWRRIARVGLANLLALLLLHAWAPGPLYGEFSVADNPLGVNSAAGLLRPARNLAWVLFGINGVLATAGVIARLRLSTGSQRQELRWIAWSGGTAVVAVVAWAVTHSERETSPFVLQGVLGAAILAIPVSAMASMAKVATLQRSVARLVLAREEERRRLRRDLHDGLGPSLAATLLQLDVAKGLVSKDAKAAREVLSRVTYRIQEAIADIRCLVDDLRPPNLDQVGLISSLRERAAEFHRAADGEDVSGRLQVEVEAKGDFSRLPAAVEVAAFRIATEALNNAARHSGAGRCTVRLFVNGALELRVEDDGIGVPAGSTSGVGLGSMKERASELGGTCYVERRPEGGTLVRARIPLDLAGE